MNVYVLVVFGLAAGSSFLDDALELDRRLRATEEAMREIRGQRELLRVETSRIEGELAAARLRYREVYGTFRKRIRALARMPRGSRLLLLGESDSLRDYLRNARLLRRLTRADRDVATERARVAARIEQLERGAKARERDVEEAEAALRSQRDQLAELRAQKIAMLDRLARDGDVAARVRREAARARDALGVLVEKLEPLGKIRRRFAQNRGRLPWPTDGELSARFGQDLERTFGTVVKHRGLDFRAPSGTPVQAIAPGTVAYADWLKGYGELVIVDHGGGYHSLYAHLDSTGVQEGDDVELGDSLGRVGDTGSLRGTVLYFELRANGVAVDPMEWLRPE